MNEMPYAFVQDLPVSWQHYQQAAAALIDPPPPGLVLHVAGPTDEGVRIIDVWADDQAWHRFRAGRLEPAIAALGRPARPQPTFRDVRPSHVVVGDAWHLPRPRMTSSQAASTGPARNSRVNRASASGAE